MPADELKIGTARDLQERAGKMLEKARGLARGAQAEQDQKKKENKENEARYFAEEARGLTKLARDLVKKK